MTRRRPYDAAAHVEWVRSLHPVNARLQSVADELAKGSRRGMPWRETGADFATHASDAAVAQDLAGQLGVIVELLPSRIGLAVVRACALNPAVALEIPKGGVLTKPQRERLQRVTARRVNNWRRTVRIPVSPKHRTFARRALETLDSTDPVQLTVAGFQGTGAAYISATSAAVGSYVLASPGVPFGEVVGAKDGYMIVAVDQLPPGRLRSTRFRFVRRPDL